MRGAVTVRAPAKINLHLGVGPVRDDGYHPLATVYQAIGMYDDVTVADAPNGAGWSLEVHAHDRIDVAEVPLDDTNIALRAGRLLAAHHGLDRAASVVIEKGIPVAGGLAGGSADAAATLLGLDRLWDLRTSDDDLLALAGELGSDVPFALVGGTAVGTGRGEVVSRVPDGGRWWWVVVESDIGLSTAAVYRALDELRRDRGSAASEPAVPDGLLAALASGDPSGLAAAVSNDLAAPALGLRPDLRAVLDAGVAAGALTGLLSGSGPTCLFLCRDHAEATAVRITLAEELPRVSTAAAPVAGAHQVSYL